jgi:hypothetical protein
MLLLCVVFLAVDSVFVIKLSVSRLFLAVFSKLVLTNLSFATSALQYTIIHIIYCYELNVMGRCCVMLSCHVRSNTVLRRKFRCEEIPAKFRILHNEEIHNL